MLSNFGPSQGQKGLENGLFWGHKWLKTGSKPWFSKKDPSRVVVPKRATLIHFLVRTSFVVEVSEVMFLPPPTRSQYSILDLVWGCWRPMCTNSGAFGGLWGQFADILWS